MRPWLCRTFGGIVPAGPGPAAELGRYAATETILRLPQEYPEIVAAGARALWAVEARLRAAALQHPEAPELWLAVRDVDGLAMRLDATSEWEWRRGFADASVTGQDLGVLDELLRDAGAPPYLDATRPARAEERASLARLRAFLGSYCGGEFEFDDPAAPEPGSGAPAA